LCAKCTSQRHGARIYFTVMEDILRESERVDALEKSVVSDESRDPHVLGGGGYGTVYIMGHQAMKVLTDKCSDAKAEYDMQVRIYNAVDDMMKETPSLRELPLAVPEPSGFNNDSGTLHGTAYFCSVLMERVFPPPGHHHMVHASLEENSSPTPNRVMYTTGSVPRPRGFFADAGYLDSYLRDTNLKSSAYVAYLMGVGVGCCLDAGIAPFDVEFVIGRATATCTDLKLYMMDFGLCENLSKFDSLSSVVHGNGKVVGLEYDIYVPTDPDLPLYKEFQRGLLGRDKSLHEELANLLEALL
jgi:hypothetical protein